MIIPFYPNDILIVDSCWPLESLAAEGPAIDRIQFGRWSP